MITLINKYLPNVLAIKTEIWQSTLETLYMTLVSGLIAGILGLLVGILLVVTGQGGLQPNRFIYQVTDKLVNICRSIPFVILLAIIAPITRLIVGTRIGVTAAIVPLVFGTIPFFARQIQNVLLAVDAGVIEAAQAMGTANIDIIFRVYLVEALPGIVRVSSLTIINLIGLTAMAGVIGGGGLGNLAIARGYSRFQNDVTWVATLLILLLVLISQMIGNLFIKKLEKRA